MKKGEGAYKINKNYSVYFHDFMIISIIHIINMQWQHIHLKYEYEKKNILTYKIYTYFISILIQIAYWRMAPFESKMLFRDIIDLFIQGCIHLYIEPFHLVRKCLCHKIYTDTGLISRLLYSSYLSMLNIY